MPESPLLDPNLIDEVRPFVSQHVRTTPLIQSSSLSERTGWNVLLKCENLQLTGSFKIRGALAAIGCLSPEERERGVVASSAGNHGLGLAYAARQSQVPCTIVTPSGVPDVKARAIERLGARRIDSPHAGYDDTEAWTREQGAELGGTFVSPFEDPAVMAGGGGTLMLEILEQLYAQNQSPPDAILAACGGGGLLSGMVTARQSKGLETRLIGVNSEASPGMWRSMQDGHAHLRIDSDETLAEGIEGGVGETTYAICKRGEVAIELVSEEAIEHAIHHTVTREHLVIEGSAAVAVAAVQRGVLERIAPEGTAVIVLSGGNIDPTRLASLLQ